MALQRSLALLLAAAATALAAAPAGAKIQIGISEQNPNMFTNKYFKPLGLKYGRMIVPWNILKRHDYWPGYLKAWLAGAKATGVEPHIVFNIQDVAPKYFGKGPTLKQYAALVKGFRKKYPQVKVFTPWNEENHVFQPTAKHPKLAYDYYRILRKACPGCKILAADVLDDSNLTSWLKQFQRYYHGSGTWGLHNYQDANKFRSLKQSWTYKITKVIKGDVWSTEAGGIVGFKTVKGRVGYKFSLTRQLKAQRHLFELMGDRKVRSRYKRVYIYDYYGTWDAKGHKDNRWDSGLLARGATGKPRPAYFDLKKTVAKNRAVRASAR
jgi:hypothetical protein